MKGICRILIQSSLTRCVEKDLQFLKTDQEANEKGKVSSQFHSPEDATLQQELKKILMESLEILTEKEKKVILLYYYEDLTLKEISNILEVSESRISQLHTKALHKMKAKLGDYIGILTNR